MQEPLLAAVRALLQEEVKGRMKEAMLEIREQLEATVKDAILGAKRI